MQSKYDDIHTPTIAAVGFLGTVATLAIVVLLLVVYYRVQRREEYVKDVSQAQGEIERLALQQRGNLADYRLLDKEKQIYAIPIVRSGDQPGKGAMELVVARRRENPEGPPGASDEPAQAPKLEGEQP
jgi:hypothetical protein